jgi:hypothetical protein
MASPWEILGLDGPVPEKDIRRAYARRLKVMDPEKDIHAFQSLLAARAQALSLAVRESRTGFETTEVSDEASVSVSPDEAQPSCQANHLQASEPGRSQAVAQPSPFEQERHRDDSGRASWLASPSDETGQRDPLGELAERLQLLSGEGWRNDRARVWDSLLEKLAGLPLGQAEHLEPDVIEAMASITLRPDVLGPVPWWKRWRRLNRFRRSHRYNDPDYLRTVLGFESLYGWLTSDSTIWQQLDEARAEGLLIHLQAARRAQSAMQEGALVTAKEEVAPSFHDWSAALTESTAPDVLALAKAHARTGRWPVVWSWRFFFLAPLMALYAYMPWLTVVWVVVFFYLPIQIKLAGFPYPYDKFLPWLCFCGVLCLHAWVGAYSYRGLIRHARRLTAKADHYRIFHPELRRTYLMGLNPDRYGRPKPQWERLRKVLTWLLWAFVCWMFGKAMLALLVVFLSSPAWPTSRLVGAIG